MVGVIDPDLYSPRMGAMFMRLLRTVANEKEAITLLTGMEPVQAIEKEEHKDNSKKKNKRDLLK
jgi:hypothetical protein